MNIVILSGNIGQDPVIRQTSSGKNVAQISVATSFGYGDNKKTIWHRIIIWGVQAEFIDKHAKKGDWVFVRGMLNYNEYTDKDGQQKKYAEIIANEIDLKKKQSDNSDASDIPENSNNVEF